MKTFMLKICVLTLFVGLFQGVFAQGGGGLSDAQIKQVEAVLAPYRKQVENVLTSDKTGTYKAYLADVESIKKLKDAKQQKEALSKLEAKYLPFLKAEYAKAKIDESDVKSKMKSVLGNMNFTIGQFLAISGTATIPTTPVNTNGCVELKCPFDTKTTSSTGSLINIATVHANDCGTDVYGFADLAGGGEAKAFTGKKVKIPSGKTKVSVTATEDYKMDGIAFALIGGSYAESQVGLKMKGPSVDKTFEYKTSWVVSPVVWFATFEETATNEDLSSSFTPSTSGGEYTIQVYSKTKVVAAAAIAGTRSISDIIKVAKIKVCWE